MVRGRENPEQQEKAAKERALESEGGRASSAMCFLNTVKRHFGCDQAPQVANVLIRVLLYVHNTLLGPLDTWTNLVLTVRRL